MATEGNEHEGSELAARVAAEVVPRLQSVLEASIALGVSRWTLYKAVRRGELRCVRIGDRLLFTVEDLRSYIETRRR